MKNLFKIALAMMMFLGIANAMDKPYKGKQMVITLASGEIMSSGIGTGLAEGAQKKGAKITVIIGANSIKYVTKENSDPLKFPAKNKTIKKVLEGMIAKGADVMVCKMCAVAAGLTQDDFIYGANITKSGPIIDAIMADNTKALIY